MVVLPACSQLHRAAVRSGLTGRAGVPFGKRSFDSQRRRVAAMAKRLDGHLHVWASREDAEAGKFPFAGGLIGSGKDSKEPPMPGHAEVLLEAMQSAKVDGAFIIQPGNHLYDHSYVTSVLRAHPDKFVGALLANPTSENCVEELSRLIQEDGYKAVRFNPYLWPKGETMTNERGRAMYKRAGELGAPVGHMPFKGLLLHIDDIRALATEYPATKVIIDHMGFCKADNPDSDEWQALLGLAEMPQVYVKLSAFFRVSSQEHPYEDAQQCVRNLVDAFGPQRLMWGTDFPWVTESPGCGYVNAWNVLPGGFFSEEDAKAIYGGTLASLFPSGFGQGSSLWADVPKQA